MLIIIIARIKRISGNCVQSAGKRILPYSLSIIAVEPLFRMGFVKGESPGIIGKVIEINCLMYGRSIWTAVGCPMREYLRPRAKGSKSSPREETELDLLRIVSRERRRIPGRQFLFDNPGVRLYPIKRSAPVSRHYPGKEALSPLARGTPRVGSKRFHLCASESPSVSICTRTTDHRSESMRETSLALSMGDCVELRSPRAAGSRSLRRYPEVGKSFPLY